MVVVRSQKSPILVLHFPHSSVLQTIHCMGHLPVIHDCPWTCDIIHTQKVKTVFVHHTVFKVSAVKFDVILLFKDLHFSSRELCTLLSCGMYYYLFDGTEQFHCVGGACMSMFAVTCHTAIVLLSWNFWKPSDISSYFKWVSQHIFGGWFICVA
jgi:hypothetical protein